MNGEMTSQANVGIQDATYSENQGTIDLGGQASFAGSGVANFAGGYIEFAITSATSFETLGLKVVSSASTTLGDISIVGAIVYRGTGTGTEVVGSVDATLNGQGGNALRINFAAAFENGSFNAGTDGSTTIPGWTSGGGVTDRVRIDGTYQIAGQATPVDTTFGAANTTGDYTTGGSFSPVAKMVTDTSDPVTGGVNDLALELDTGGSSIGQPYGTIRGPYLYSNSTVALQAGDQLSFAWRALSGGDAYDAYGYLVNVNDGSTITLLDQTGTDGGQSTNWATVSRTIAAGEQGVYRFVFISGSYDASGGQYLGGKLMIDDINVVQANPPVVDEAVLQAIARAVTYTNTGDDIPGSSRTVTMTASDGGTTPATFSDTATIAVTQTNDAPTFSGSAVLAPVLEDTTNPLGDTVQNVVGAVFQDADASFTPGDSLQGIVIAGDASTASQGVWQYSTNNGATWLAVGAVSAAAGLALDTTAKLRFVPFAEYNGTPGALTIHALDSTFTGTFSTGATRVTANVTTNGGASAISGAGTLTTSITPVIDYGPADITAATDSGADDFITRHGNPVIRFTGESGFTISVDGPDAGSTNLAASQYSVAYSSGAYTVTLVDADTSLAGNQGFGTYGPTGVATGNPTNSGDGVYTIIGLDTVAGISRTIATITIDRTAPSIVGITSASSADARSATYTVTFAEAVSGIDVSDFSLATTGNVAGKITGVSGSGSTYNVTVARVAGTGTMRLDLNGSDTGIMDLAGNSIAGGYTSGTARVVQVLGPQQTIGNVDISSDTGQSASDFITSASRQTITATLSGALGVGDRLFGSLDGGNSWVNVTNKLTGQSLTWGDATLLEGGARSIQFKVVDRLGRDGPVAEQAYMLDRIGPGIGVQGIDISDDTGSSASDFVTAMASQTITARLDAALGSNTLQGSLDGGRTWRDISDKVGGLNGTEVSWDGVVLQPGQNSIQFRAVDVAGNVGRAFSQSVLVQSTVSITATDADKLEGTGASWTNFSFKVTLDSATDWASTVAWRVAGSGADQATAADFLDGTNGGLPSGSLTFAPGEVEKTLVIRVRNDNIFAQDESFSVTLSGETPALRMAVASAIGVIRNDDDLIGGASADRLLGSNSSEAILGLAGNDTLSGRNGSDTLIGGVGADSLSGGTGADHFRYDAVAESTSRARDTIVDFGLGDRIDLSRIDANSLLGGDQAFVFIGSAAFTAAGQVRFANGIVEANVDANLQADFQLALRGASALTAADFIL
jgi:hypothetical protein